MLQKGGDITRFQCVNWISWKQSGNRRRHHESALLASNALIGLVGNSTSARCTLLQVGLASNALIGLVGNPGEFV